MKGLSICLIVEGAIWALVAGWMNLALLTMADPISGLSMAISIVWQSSGPFALILGGILVLKGIHTKLGTSLTLIGSLALTLIVVYQSLPLHVDHLQMPPPRAFHAVLLVISMLFNIVAIRLFYMVFYRGIR
jgi:hypothetical protein